MKTPDEARQCWCPFARVMYRERIVQAELDAIAMSSFNRVSNGEPDGTRCIADECMAWRWAVSEPYQDDSGYCGLAGKP